MIVIMVMIMMMMIKKQFIVHINSVASLEKLSSAANKELHSYQIKLVMQKHILTHNAEETQQCLKLTPDSGTVVVIYINASTTMYEAHKTNNRHLPPLKCTFTAVHHVWVVVTPVSGEIRADLPQLAVRM